MLHGIGLLVGVVAHEAILPRKWLILPRKLLRENRYRMYCYCVVHVRNLCDLGANLLNLLPYTQFAYLPEADTLCATQRHKLMNRANDCIAI